MKEYNTEEYFQKHGFTDGGYVNKCEPKFRKEFFCEFLKEPNFFMIKIKYSINDMVCYKGKNFTIIGVTFEAVDEGWEAQYTLQDIEKNEIFYRVPKYKIFAVRSPKYKIGDIVRSFVWNVDYQITGVEVELPFTTYVYNVISLDGNNYIDKATEKYIEQTLEKNAKRRNKFKLGDIVKWTGYKEIDFKITSIIDDGKTFCYSLEATSGVCGCNRVREEELSSACKYCTAYDNIGMAIQDSKNEELAKKYFPVSFCVGDWVTFYGNEYEIVSRSDPTGDKERRYSIESRYGEAGATSVRGGDLQKINEFSIGNVVKYDNQERYGNQLFVINSIKYDGFQGIYYLMSPIGELDAKTSTVVVEKDLVKYASEVIFR